jgi:hypothetical protein
MPKRELLAAKVADALAQKADKILFKPACK